ncbi:MAG: R3H domain-containing nucleic acid-binding protein [Acidobacteriota bacterium]
MSDLNTRIADFVTAVTAAMGLNLTASIEDTPDGPRVNMEGEGGDFLVRKRGEALTALQHITSSVFRDDLPEGQRLAVDCLGFQQDKDGELRKMAKFLAEKALLNKAPQEMGPLNPYERRIVHLAIQEVPNATSESIGDAFMKTVIISGRS